MVADIILSGVFNQNAYVAEAVIGTCFNNMFWQYDSYDINQFFVWPSDIQFHYQVVFPKSPGSYLSNIQLNAPNHICCWQVEYTIS